MVHGRDHDNRSAHVRPSRHNNTPDDPESEPAVEARPSAGELPPAPTRRAQENEAQRLSKKDQ
jgi:hypothetical protein